MKRILLTLLIVPFLLAPALAADVNYAVGAYLGIAPSLGGNLFTYQHESVFDSSTGIYGMNRKDDALGTTQIEPLTGFSAGGMFKTLLYDYFQVRIACNYTRSYLGGTGTTVYLQGGVNTALDCEYSFWAIDAPLTFGLVIPFWKDIKLSFNCGIAYAYGQYQYSFESTAGQWKGSFTGYGLPVVMLIEGEYFLTDRIAMASSLLYYRGTSKVLSDGSNTGGKDFARLDFSGYRFNLGVTFYFLSI